MARSVYDSDADEWVYEEEIETSGGSYRVPLTYGVVTWATRPGLNDDDNPLLQAAKAKLVEVEAKKRVPAKSGPPQLILDEPAPWQAARARASKPGWADEIAHEVAEEERERQNECLLAAAKKLEQQPELMIDLCEAYLKDATGGAWNLMVREQFGSDPPYRHIGKLMSLFAIDCLSFADAPASLGREYEGFELRYLLRLAKLGGWGGLKD